MAKRQRSVSLSFVLFRFVVVMLGCMLFCCLVWLFAATLLQNTGVVYPGYTANQQVEKMLAAKPNTFVSPGDDFLAEYALFDQSGIVLESNVEGKELESLIGFWQEGSQDVSVSRYTYEDDSTVIIRWQYRKEFASPVLRAALPPFEYLWWGALGVALVLCLLINTLWLRRCLAAKLQLFSEVSEKIGTQELDFIVPQAGIQEYDQALGAMEDMRKALYSSLSAQWAAQQEREAEIAALAHDLKTPLTLVGGNAELLLDEELSASSRKKMETIIASNQRAKQYVASLLEASAGTDEAFESTSLSALFDELCQNTIAIAEAKMVCLQTQNDLKGTVYVQKAHLLRALGNVVQNAIEHTPAGGNVYLKGCMLDKGWQLSVCDEGTGFGKAALLHATERLWRGNTARSSDGHHGLGLWFAAQVVETHAGEMEFGNWDSGGVVTVRFCQTVRDNSQHQNTLD